MERWNIAGFVAFLVVAGFTGWGFTQGNSGINLMPLFLFTFFGVVLLGVDRWAGNTKYGVFPVALLWAGYWGFVAFGLISIAGLYGFALGFGHGNSEKMWIAKLLMYGYASVAVLFIGLALTNLIRSIVALFSLPKLESH